VLCLVKIDTQMTITIQKSFDINAASSSDLDENDRSDLSDIKPERHILQIDHLKSIKKPIKC